VLREETDHFGRVLTYSSYGLVRRVYQFGTPSHLYRQPFSLNQATALMTTSR
jgi:hypothetical protein